MNQPEATVAACKCREGRRTYGVRFERVSSRQWKYTWAFPMKEDSAKREGYDATVIEGMIDPDPEYPGCPYCGIKYFVICSCGKLNCNNSVSGKFTCQWCGTTGTLVAYGGAGIRSGGDR